MTPLGVFHETRGVEQRREMCRERFRAAAGARDAREAFGKVDQFVVRHDGAIDHAKSPET